MELLGAWLAYPVVALAISLALGLLVDRVGGHRLPGVLLLPVGMAGIIAATQLTTYWGWSAPLTLPLLLVLALAGLWLGRRRLRSLRPDVVPALAAVGVFAVYAAPVVLTGHASFAGYTVLGDTSIHFIGADALLEHGRDFSGLPPSSYEYSLVQYYGATGYPSGGPTAAGALTSLVGMDVSLTFQAFLSLLAAMTALALYSLTSWLIGSRALRGAIAFLAAQPALFVAYALQGSVKEVGSAFGVVLLGALAAVYIRERASGGWSWVPLAVAAAALVGIVGLAGAVWLGPLMLGTAALRLVATHAPLRVARDAAGFIVTTGLLVYQSLIGTGGYVQATGNVLHAQQELGNLLRPLKFLQMFGVWIAGDYRGDPELSGLTNVIIAVVIAAVVIGLVWAIARRAWPELLFLAVSAFAWWYVTRTGSPWADGKALMIVSPAVMLAAGFGLAALAGRWRGVVGWGVAVVVAFGVLLSNAYAYHDVSDAPHDRMAELQHIGERFAGQGPTLYTEFEEFGKHYLRREAPEGSSEGWQRRYALALEKQPATFGAASDPDQFTDRYLDYYRTIVVRRGFEMSRPPSIYSRAYHGRYYDVWQRTQPASTLLGRVTDGVPRQPAAPARCRDVRGLASLARRAGGKLAYVPRAPTVAWIPGNSTLAAGWFVDGTDSALVHPNGPGTMGGPVGVPRTGRYDVWLEGSIGRPVTVQIDGREVARPAYELSNRLTSIHLATVHLAKGRHHITVIVGGGSLRPGSGGINRTIGPVALTSPDPNGTPVRTLPPSRWRSLCGRSVDWVEAVR